MRLDKILWLFGGFDFIKLDAEGGEPAIIRSLGEHRPKRMSLEYHGGKCDLRALDGVTNEALELLGFGYMYRFAAESSYWVSDWFEIDQAVSLLDSLAWGDVYCLRKDIFADEQP
jgi:hypothetical protein